MRVLRSRAKKMMRSKHKKTIKLTDLDRVWSDWVEFNILRPLIKYGSVQIDEKTSIEIVGKTIINDKASFNLLANGRAITKTGRFVEPKRLSGRADYIYKIVMTDDNYKKGQLVFEADKKLKKMVREALEDPLKYYKIIK